MDRRSIRLRGHDYGGPGAYFVTVCARTHLFGRVHAGEVSPSRYGEITSHCFIDADDVRANGFGVRPPGQHEMPVVGLRALEFKSRRPD